MHERGAFMHDVRPNALPARGVTAALTANVQGDGWSLPPGAFEPSRVLRRGGSAAPIALVEKERMCVDVDGCVAGVHAGEHADSASTSAAKAARYLVEGVFQWRVDERAAPPEKAAPAERATLPVRAASTT